MALTSVLEAAKSLVVARVVKVHNEKDNAVWAIAHVLDIETLAPKFPKQSIFLNALVLQTRFQYFQIGPFRTPLNIDLGEYGLPKSGDIILGETGTNYKGEIYTSWLPDRWARPISYFFFYMTNSYEATKLYENTDAALRMVLLSRLTVPYGRVRDERLYDLLCLILFDDTDTLVEMCYKAQHRPKDGRSWNLQDKTQHKKITAFCASYGGSSPDIPSVPEFVEEAAYLVGDSGICAHFRSILANGYQESKGRYCRELGKWLQDQECLSSRFIQTLLDQKSVQSGSQFAT